MDVHVSLDADLACFVEDEVSSGRYGATGDVLREALRLMQALRCDDVERLRALQNAWQDGIDSGDAGELDVAALKREARERSAATRA